MSPPVIRMLLDYWPNTLEEPDTVLTTVEDVEGQPARTLAQWATDHAAVPPTSMVDPTCSALCVA